jgi:hypothetical protein
VVDREFVGLNVIQFFNVFYDDNAPYNFVQFQKKRGDKNIQYGPWGTTSATAGPLSLHPPTDAPTDTLTTMPYTSFQTRRLTFLAKTNTSSLLGPPYATTTKTQRMLIVSKRVAVLEMKTVLADIPFCDRFFVLERWLLVAHKNSRGRYTTRVTVQTGVVITKSCPFDAMIRHKSSQAVADVVQAWCRMATQALELTERAKRDRLQQEQDDNVSVGPEEVEATCHEEPDEDENAIEIGIEQYTSSCQPRRVQSSLHLGPAPKKPYVNLRRSVSQLLHGSTAREI